MAHLSRCTPNSNASTHLIPSTARRNNIICDSVLKVIDCNAHVDLRRCLQPPKAAFSTRKKCIGIYRSRATSWSTQLLVACPLVHETSEAHPQSWLVLPRLIRAHAQERQIDTTIVINKNNLSTTTLNLCANRLYFNGASFEPRRGWECTTARGAPAHRHVRSRVTQCSVFHHTQRAPHFRRSPRR